MEPAASSSRPHSVYSDERARAAKLQSRFERKTAGMTRPQAGREAEAIMLAQARKIFEMNADRDKLRARVTSLSTELVEEREKLAEKADEVEGLWGAHAELEDVKRKLESDQRLLKIWRDRHTEADKVVQSSRREAYGLRTAVSILKEDRKVPLSDRHFNEENWPYLSADLRELLGLLIRERAQHVTDPGKIRSKAFQNERQADRAAQAAQEAALEAARERTILREEAGRQRRRADYLEQ